jgi:hypothetical protein
MWETCRRKETLTTKEKHFKEVFEEDLRGSVTTPPL